MVSASKDAGRAHISPVDELWELSLTRYAPQIGKLYSKMGLNASATIRRSRAPSMRVLRKKFGLGASRLTEPPLPLKPTFLLCRSAKNYIPSLAICLLFLRADAVFQLGDAEIRFYTPGCAVTSSNSKPSWLRAARSAGSRSSDRKRSTGGR